MGDFLLTFRGLTQMNMYQRRNLHVILFIYFWDRVSPCNLCFLWFHYVDWAALKFKETHLPLPPKCCNSAIRVLRLNLCITKPSQWFISWANWKLMKWQMVLCHSHQCIELSQTHIKPQNWMWGGNVDFWTCNTQNFKIKLERAVGEPLRPAPSAGNWSRL